MVWPYNTNVPLNRSCSALLLCISSSAFFYDAKVNKKVSFTMQHATTKKIQSNFTQLYCADLSTYLDSKYFAL